MMKVIVISILISLILFYVFYYIDAAILLPSLKKKKEKINKIQEDFWNRMKEENIEKIKFLNNLNYELRELYYSEEKSNIIDFDIIDYNLFEEEIQKEDFYIKVNLDIRIVRLKNQKIISKVENKTYLLKRNKKEKELTGKVNFIRCRNCGASIDATKKECPYCKTSHNYLQDWYIEKERNS